MKLLILIISISCCFCGVLWSLSYYLVFGFGLTALLPFLFVVIVGSAIFVAHKFKEYRILIYVQLTCITWISALIQWSIGSMSDSGLVIMWSYLGPLGALIFLSFRQAFVWMLMFIVIIVISAVYEPMLLGSKLVVSSNNVIIFYIMNLVASLSVVFAASVWFVNTIKFERSRAEKLLRKIQTLFGQHVSSEVAEKLMSNDSDEIKSKTYAVTIMFLDIRGFTLLADSRAPYEVAALQNTVFSELINIIRDNSGIVIQILGDGIYAAFGAPIENETHPQDAVNSGYSILEKVKELYDNGKIPLIELGLGLHSGKVIAGEVGNEYRKSFSLAGSNVIIAARIEQLCKEMKSSFLISETVFNNIKLEKNAYKYLGKQSLKGISKPIGIYQLD